MSEGAASTGVSPSPAMRASVAPTFSQDTTGELPTASSTADSQQEPMADLGQTFSSPDGPLSFDYPAGWTVVAREAESYPDFERSEWVVNDAESQSVLTLTVETDVPLPERLH